MGLGSVLEVARESFPSPPKWSTSDIPDLSGKVIIVTGGNAGIGKETARTLLTHNARVYIGCRSPAKARAAADDLKRLTGKTDADLVVLGMDLSDLGSVKAAVDEFLSKESRLDVLINSAGIMAPPHSELTKDGIDLQFGTNVLGHFYLSKLLLPLLIASAKTSKEGRTRLMNVSSSVHLLSPTLDLETLVGGVKRDRVTTTTLYHQSKAGVILTSNAQARRYGDTGVTVISLNPGNIETELQRNLPPYQHKLTGLLLHPVELGALTQLYAATAPEAAELNGEYLGPWARLRPARKDMADIAKQEELWAWLEEQLRLFAPK